MKPLSIGDRVRIYANNYAATKHYGTVTIVDEKEYVSVLSDNYGERVFYRKQVRRLVPKKEPAPVHEKPRLRLWVDKALSSFQGGSPLWLTNGNEPLRLGVSFRQVTLSELFTPDEIRAAMKETK